MSNVATEMVRLGPLLRNTSRSFYLTLRVLPGAIRPQIGLAYLLARTSDTIADTELVPVDQRLAALVAFRECLNSSAAAPPDFGELAAHQGSAAEKVLLENCRSSLGLLRALSAPDRDLVVWLLRVIVGGQELDLRRFGRANAKNIIALQHAGELDDYTYRVAGCVGEFWTRICRSHVFPKASLDDAVLLAEGVRFGKGLQLVNILRDLPADLRHGRCYLPLDQLQARGLKPHDLLLPANEPQLRPLYDLYLDQAQAHLSTGWTYTNRWPRRRLRLRLACAWPLLIGAETISLLRRGSVLNADRRVKISRREVKRILLRSVLYYPVAGRWEGLFAAALKFHDDH